MKKSATTLLLLFVFTLSGCSIPLVPSNQNTNSSLPLLSKEEAKAKAEDFINKNLMQGGTATIAEITEEDGLYKLSVSVGQPNNIIAYMTKDGSKFFPQTMDVAEIEKKKAEAEALKEKAIEELPKAEIPTVELFVMSHCPYGTQIEKGMLPVLDVLKSKINFQLKFVDYAMHGEKELQEQLNQYCIGKNEPQKLTSYLKCFLEKENNTDACIVQVGLNKTKLSGCIKQADTEFKVTKNFKDKTTWKGTFPPFAMYKADNEKYGVQGSPTVVINGKVVETSRDSAGLLKTICATFTTQPEECKTQLSADAPAPGFGFTQDPNSTPSNASCG